jgi:ferredoxin--NADP+ reductase
MFGGNVMFKIIRKRELAPKTKLFEILAPEIANKAQPGQFVILRACKEGERIPLTIADFNGERGTITVVFQEVGKTTKLLGAFNEGDEIPDVLGPLGKPAEIEKFGRVICVGSGVFAAPMALQARAFKAKGNYVIGVNVARRKNLVIFEEEFRAVCDEFYISTDDGSRGYQGIDFLKGILDRGVDRVVVFGLVPIQRKICELTKPYGVKTMVDLMPIMVDGMGMCGTCRVTVGGETKFACVDGPEFDGHLVDFDELIRRQRMYTPEEKIASVIYERLGGFRRD